MSQTRLIVVGLLNLGLKNSNPKWLMDGFFGFVGIIQDSGWILLVIMIGFWFLIRKLERHLRAKRRRDDDSMHAKDPDKVLDLVREGFFHVNVTVAPTSSKTLSLIFLFLISGFHLIFSFIKISKSHDHDEGW